MKFLLLSIFFTSNYYFPISEIENSSGYTDIYLKRSHLHPNAISEWVLELKYVKKTKKTKKTDSNKEPKATTFDQKKNEAIEQLKRYKTSNLFKDRTDVRFLAVVFTGKNEYDIWEV